MLNYQLATSSATPLDADYKPTLDEWIRLDDLSAWQLYSHNAFLTVSFKRSPNPKDPSGPGIYLVRYNLTASANHYKRFVEPQRRDEWKKLLPEILKDLSVRRSATQTALRDKGIPIADDYVDTPIPE